MVQKHSLIECYGHTSFRFVERYVRIPQFTNAISLLGRFKRKNSIFSAPPIFRPLGIAIYFTLGTDDIAAVCLCAAWQKGSVIRRHYLSVGIAAAQALCATQMWCRCAAGGTDHARHTRRATYMRRARICVERMTRCCWCWMTKGASRWIISKYIYK